MAKNEIIQGFKYVIQPGKAVPLAFPGGFLNRLGYLLEVPIIFLAVLLFLSIFLPKLSGMAGKTFAVAGGSVLIGGIFYMILIPGWQPGNSGRLPYPWNLLLLAALATMMILGTGAYVFYF